MEVTHPNGIDTNKTTDTNTIEQPAKSPGLIAKTFDNVASVVVIRLALAAAAAFIAAAFVQRLLLADFAVKLGASGIELGEVSEKSSQSIEKLTELVNALSAKTNAKTSQLSDTLDALNSAVIELRQRIG